MWKDTNFGDTRLSSSDVVMSQWWEQVLANDTRFLSRISNCGDQVFHSSSLANFENGLYRQQQVTTQDSAMSIILGPVNDDLLMNASALSNRPYLIYTSGIVLIASLLTMTILRFRKQKRLTLSTLRTFESPNRNNGRLYGAIVFNED